MIGPYNLPVTKKMKDKSDLLRTRSYYSPVVCSTNKSKSELLTDVTQLVGKRRLCKALGNTMTPF